MAQHQINLLRVTVQDDGMRSWSFVVDGNTGRSYHEVRAISRADAEAALRTRLGAMTSEPAVDEPEEPGLATVVILSATTVYLMSRLEKWIRSDR